MRPLSCLSAGSERPFVRPFCCGAKRRPGKTKTPQKKGKKNAQEMLEVARRAARGAAREAERGVRRARRVADDPRAHLVAGALASGLVLAGLYTESAECSALEEAQRLDSDVREASGQAEFDRLMERWTRAATLYSAALKEGCAKAQYALGRLCVEGRGYVYDPELGVALYDSAAANGNPDAQFALATICYLVWTRHLQEIEKGTDVTDREEQEEVEDAILHAQQAMVYRLSRLLSLASRKGHEKAVSALSDIYKLDLRVAGEWVRNTKECLLTAASTSNDARAQSYSLSWGERPKKGEGGWRARVIAAEVEDTPALLEYTMKRKKSGEADQSEMRAVSKLAESYLLAYEDDARVRAKASALRDQAARMGDIQAINDQYDSADKKDPKAIASILSRGVKVGSGRLLLERGRMYRRQNKANEAERDFVCAAELGVWDALQEYLAMHGAQSAQSEQVEVSPLSAALEVLKMRTHRALCERQGLDPPFLVAALPADSASIRSMDAGARDVPRATPGAASGSVNARPEVVTTHITWPKINVSTERSAMSDLQSVYAHVLKTMDDIEKEWELGQRDQITLLLEPIPREMLGPFAGAAPEITKRALLLALQGRRPKAKITMCVFESIPTVAAYARAFRTSALDS